MNFYPEPDVCTAVIVGCGHSGSTLLDRIIGIHSQAVSLGEMKYFDTCVAHNHTCACGKLIHDCDFWSPVIQAWHEQLRHQITLEQVPLHIPTDSRVNRKKSVRGRVQYLLSYGIVAFLPLSMANLCLKSMASSEYAQAVNIHKLYDIIRKIGGSPMIIDSSKTAHRMKLLWLTQPEKTRAIFLTRDARGFAWSYMRKESVPAEEAAKVWLQGNKRTALMLRTVPESSRLHISYEQICRETETTLKTLCYFLGVEYEQNMLNFGSEVNHTIGGNRMRHRRDIVIQEDTQWRRQLSVDDLVAIEKVAGSYNRELLGDYYID